MWEKQELLTALKDQLIESHLEENIAINEVIIDSRKKTKNSLFIAIKGENNDGHNFLKNAKENGSELFLIENKDKLPKNSQFLLVKDTFKALYDLAKFSRARSKARIIAITGSVGKTSTKELLQLTFSQFGKTFATPGNLNNHFGVPLCLCNLSEDHEFAIFEMGMNHAHEISPLSKLAKPDLAIITTIAPVHIENFENVADIALAKAEIFDGLGKDGLILLNKDNEYFNFLKEKALASGKNKIFSFGKDQSSDFILKKSEITALNSSNVLAKIKEKEINYKISTASKVNIFNSIIAVAALNLLCPNKILEEINNFKEGQGRGEILEVKFNDQNLTIIDDSYNSSLPSVKSGIDHALNLKKSLNKKRMVVILGDMLELGEKSVALHEEVAKHLKNIQFDFVILVGKEMSNIAAKIPNKNNKVKTFSNSKLASLEIETFVQDNDLVYVKGSRGMAMENIVNKLKNVL